MVAGIEIRGEDIDIEKLVPLNMREINLKKNRGYRKILSSMKAIGLIDPLYVYPENGHFVILDGFLRYKACQELGITRVPCQIRTEKEAYTYNKMINRLSAVQESRMLRESLKTLDQATISEVFGVKSIQYRLGSEMLKQLDPKVISAIDRGSLSRRAARELTFVTTERQREILREMNRTEDYSIAFARALVIKTPESQRNKDKKMKTPWAKDPEKKQELVTKLEAIQKRYDFYSNLYRQYSADLLKLHVYVRKLLTDEKIRLYLEINFPDIYAQFESIVFETKGVAS